MDYRHFQIFIKRIENDDVVLYVAMDKDTASFVEGENIIEPLLKRMALQLVKVGCAPKEIHSKFNVSNRLLSHVGFVHEAISESVERLVKRIFETDSNE